MLLIPRQCIDPNPELSQIVPVPACVPHVLLTSATLCVYVSESWKEILSSGHATFPEKFQAVMSTLDLLSQQLAELAVAGNVAGPGTQFIRNFQPIVAWSFVRGRTRPPQWEKIIHPADGPPVDIYSVPPKPVNPMSLFNPGSSLSSLNPELVVPIDTNGRIQNVSVPLMPEATGEDLACALMQSCRFGAEFGAVTEDLVFAYMDVEHRTDEQMLNTVQLPSMAQRREYKMYCSPADSVFWIKNSKLCPFAR